MGKGDRRTRRGKIWRGTYGKYRLKPKKKRKKRQKMLQQAEAAQEAGA